jgi:hypothetical protein
MGGIEHLRPVWSLYLIRGTKSSSVLAIVGMLVADLPIEGELHSDDALNGEVLASRTAAKSEEVACFCLVLRTCSSVPDGD